jgi:DNA-binding NarL/FixJ family response regulator
MTIRVLLVEDHKIMREGLRALLERQSDIQIAAEVEKGADAAKAVREIKPDVVIMDIGLPDLNGIQATEQILAEFPDTKILALTMHSEKGYVNGMLRAGAMGYLLKDCAADELVRAVREIVAGKGYISPEVTRDILKDISKTLPAQNANTRDPLNDKETAVLRSIAEGESMHDIAKKLDLSVKTVERYRAQIMEKLQIFSVAELTKYAIRSGLSRLT